MAYKKRASSGVDWLPMGSPTVIIAGALGAGAQATILDAPIVNPQGGQAYGSGALVGLRGWFSQFLNFGVLTPPELVCLVLPAGMAVPSVLTDALLKTNEKFVWWMKDENLSNVAQCCESEVEIRSARRFDQNDRLVIVLINRDVAATGANWRTHQLVDIYVRED